MPRRSTQNVADPAEIVTTTIQLPRAALGALTAAPSTTISTRRLDVEGFLLDEPSLTPRDLRRLHRDGLPAVELAAGNLLVLRSDLETWLRARASAPAASAPAPAEDTDDDRALLARAGLRLHSGGRR